MAAGANGNLNVHDGVEVLRKGARVWFRLSGQDWAIGELAADPAESCSVLLSDGRSVVVQTTQVQPANPKLQDGIDNLTSLSYLNEPCILHDLRHRYSEDQIYTFAGPVLVAINPCRDLPLYTPEVASFYKKAAKEHSPSLMPHVYLVAAAAFREMVREQQSQSLVVSGESGAGKTETAKRAMQYFATLAGGTGIEDQVLETNPILEAFGNAKTLRNHNSSRFGKLTEIHFNQSNHICGARIRTYLLEKSRVVAQLQRERSYHIFYQLMRGVTHAERLALKLPLSLAAFRFLNQSGCTDIDGVDDAVDFKVTRSAMSDVGISEDSQMSLFRLLSAILWLGNVQFKAGRQHDSSDVVDGEAWANACHLLGVDPAKLGGALTQKKIVARGEIVVRLRTPEEAADTRDALAKTLYAGMFSWVVEAINGKLSSGVDRKSSGRFIAILDIYGFESFDTNSFEQLCINYANERLQQQFNEHLFKLEQALYESEGIDWALVAYTDNSSVLDCIEAVPPKGLGILSVLDSQCKFPKASDLSFLAKLKETLGAHPNFTSNPREPNEFIVQHYAGAVQYNVNGFLDKNKDTLGTDLVEAVQSSSWPFLVDLAGEIAEDAAAKRGGATVSGRFSQQLRELIEMLDTTGLHFVRCIKPNTALAPRQFVLDMVLHQLRNSGVLEVARVARAGFPTRYVHHQFVERYAMLLPPAMQAGLATEPTLRAVQHLLQAFRVDASQYQIGRTRVFFRVGVLGYIEDAWARMQRAVPLIQATWRMYRTRRDFLMLRDTAIQLQSGYRARQPRFVYSEMLRRHRASRQLARSWRSYQERVRFLDMKEAAVVVQRAWRAAVHAGELAEIKRARLARELAARIAEEERRRKEESFEAMKREFGVESIDDVKAALAAYLRAGKEGAVNLSLRSMSLRRQQSGSMTNKRQSLDYSPSIIQGVSRSENNSMRDDDAMFLPSPPAVNSGRDVYSPNNHSEANNITQRSTTQSSMPHNSYHKYHDSDSEEEQSSRHHVTEALNPLALKAMELENLKLKRQLELERQLRERNDQRMEDSQKQINEQMKMMQEYIKLLAVQQQQQPSMTSRPHVSRQSSGGYNSEMVNTNPGHSGLMNWGSTMSSPVNLISPNGSAQLLSPSVSGNIDLMPAPQQRPRSSTGVNPYTSSDPRYSDRGIDRGINGPMGMNAARRTTNDSMGSGGSTPQGSVVNALRQQHSGTTPRQHDAASVERVQSLDNEYYTISRTLTDDASFIQEVKDGLVDAPGMDPHYELQRLKLKFGVWKKEFKEKIKTTEMLLKNIDKLREQRATSAPRNRWTPTRSRALSPSRPSTANSQGYDRVSHATEDVGAATRRRIRGFFSGNLFASRKSEH